MTERLALAVAELVEALREELRAEVPPTRDRLLSIDEGAALLGLGRSALYGEIAAGHLRTIKVGRRRLVPAAAVADFIAERRV